jgi:hypothetical protein
LPIGTVGGTCVSAVAAFSGVAFTTTTVCHFTVVTCAPALGAMRNGEISLQHVDMIRPRFGINQSPDDAARENLIGIWGQRERYRDARVLEFAKCVQSLGYPKSISPGGACFAGICGARWEDITEERGGTC